MLQLMFLQELWISKSTPDGRTAKHYVLCEKPEIGCQQDIAARLTPLRLNPAIQQ